MAEDSDSRHKFLIAIAILRNYSMEIDE